MLALYSYYRSYPYTHINLLCTYTNTLTGDQKRSTSTSPHTSSHTWQTTPATSTTSTRPTKRPIHTNTATTTNTHTVVKGDGGGDGGKLHPSWISKQKKEHTGMISSIPITSTSAAVVNKKIVFNDD